MNHDPTFDEVLLDQDGFHRQLINPKIPEPYYWGKFFFFNNYTVVFDDLGRCWCKQGYAEPSSLHFKQIEVEVDGWVEEKQTAELV